MYAARIAAAGEQDFAAHRLRLLRPFGEIGE